MDSHRIGISYPSAGKRFRAERPTQRSDGTPPGFRSQPDALCKGRTVADLLVAGKSLQARRRMRVRAVIDVFRAGGPTPRLGKLIGALFPLRLLPREVRGIREQQRLELIRLNVREEPVRTASCQVRDLLMQGRLNGRSAVQGIRRRTGESRKVQTEVRRDQRTS